MAESTGDNAFWDGIAETYAAKPVEDMPAFERKIAVVRELLGPDDRVIDVGCGTGSLALRLADAAREVHGLDLSAEMVRIAREKTAAQGVENVHLRQGALGSVEEDPFDVVLAFSLLQLVRDQQAAVRDLFELVRPGGHLVSSTVCLGDGWIPYGPVLTLMRWLGRAPHVALLRREELLGWLEAAGFEEVRVVDVGAKADIAFVVARRPGPT